ncbi:Anoctamin like protein [Aduncisulcus paluster]|uniref:Anoctamin like protein n=1 Tax=Aduncisulcus paluster TaxID=2918883 RepID=A0ABQ5K1R9_9EUKA|nr:Anoctamin like protein [Aduncisulcus paluster]|eukprot:gnl/Carplike_NY0171/794_a1090_1462.p1 GENE.gnl/Carplike_NY0171/794_a1090_1462~~gnl/Carplike_NY0171/794_a1090_1462.p1  ORF type:complete len:617 (+),score=215.22 gnl/Carplike_NY0171/794_a1090_1462:207-2057(+)
MTSEDAAIEMQDVKAELSEEESSLDAEEKFSMEFKKVLSAATVCRTVDHTSYTITSMRGKSPEAVVEEVPDVAEHEASDSPGVGKSLFASLGFDMDAGNIEKQKEKAKQSETFADSTTSTLEFLKKTGKKGFLSSISGSQATNWKELKEKDLRTITLDLQQAEVEYRFRDRLSFCGSSLHDIGEVYGHGVRYYFFFLRFLCVANFIQFLFQLIPIINYMIERKRQNLEESSLGKLLFWSEETLPYVSETWKVASILCVVFWFVSGIIYGIVVNAYKKKVKEEEIQARIDKLRDILGVEVEFKDDLADEENEEEDPYKTATEGSSLSDEREENMNLSAGNRFVRHLFSWLIFVVCLCVSASCIYLLYRIPTSTNETINTFLPIIVSVSIVLLNAIFKTVGKILPEKLERNRTWSATRKSILVKTFMFKIVNLMVLYAVSGLVTAEGDEEVTNCPLTSTGKQFTTNIIMELTVFNAIELGMPLITFLIKRKYQNSKKTDEELRKPWDQSDEYLELFYRLCQTYFGTLGSPLIGLLAGITNIVEISVDKTRLFYINRIPQRMMSSMKGFIVFYMFVIALCGFFSYPNGAFIAMYNLWSKDKELTSVTFFNRPDYANCFP